MILLFINIHKVTRVVLLNHSNLANVNEWKIVSVRHYENTPVHYTEIILVVKI